MPKIEQARSELLQVVSDLHIPEIGYPDGPATQHAKGGDLIAALREIARVAGQLCSAIAQEAHEGLGAQDDSDDVREQIMGSVGDAISTIEITRWAIEDEHNDSEPFQRGGLTGHCYDRFVA